MTKINHLSTFKCLDTYNLYGWAKTHIMDKHLLTGEVKWLAQDEINKRDLNIIREGTKGRILEVHLFRIVV